MKSTFSKKNGGAPKTKSSAEGNTKSSLVTGSMPSNIPGTESSTPSKKRRKVTLKEYADPYAKAGKDIPKSKDYHNISLPWATLNPGVIHTLTQLVNTEAIAIDCRKKVLSHLTTHDVSVHDKHGTPVALEPQYNVRFQRYYKKFVREAYQAFLIHGLLPMVMIEDDSGFFFPVVAKLGTYVIQTAFCAEDEKQYYRVLRPIYFCARPDRLKYYEKIQDFAFPLPFDSIYGGTYSNAANIQIGPHPAAGQDFTTSPVKDKGWFVDTSINVLDVFDCAPSPLGDVRSPLMGLLFPHNMTKCLGDIMLRAEYKMLTPAFLVENKTRNNVDERPQGATARQGGSASSNIADPVERERANARDILTMGMENILSPLPAIDRLTPHQVMQIRAQQREMEKCSSSSTLSNPEAIGGDVIGKYHRKLMEDGVRGEVDGKVRFCPEGYVFSGANKHPETHAGARYFESKEDFSRMICSSFGIPISLIYTMSKESSGVQEGQMKVFQRSISNTCIQFNNILTQLFRESLSENTKQFPRMVSIKAVSEDFGYIDADNNRHPGRFDKTRFGSGKGTSYGGIGMMSAQRSSRTIPEMLPRFSALPTPSEETVKHIIQSLPENNDRGSPIRDADDSAKRKSDTTKTPTESFEKDDEYDKKTLNEKFSGDPIEPLSATANMRLKEEMMKVAVETHKKSGVTVREHGTASITNETSSSSGGKKRKKDIEFEITDLTICLDPVIYYEREPLLEVAKAGAISPEQYQRLLCEGNGITQSTAYGGMQGARENANFFNVIEFGEIGMLNEKDKEGRSQDHEKDVFKMAEKKEKNMMEAEHKFAKENPPAPSSGGGAAKKKKK